MKSKKFIVDVLLNIVSVALPLFVLQLVSLPIVANKVGADHYGIIIVLISAITVIAFPLGNVLNNIRLLQEEQYQKEMIKGDFNVILTASSAFAAVVIIIVTWFIDSKLEIHTIALLVMIVVASLIKDYLVVGFRLNLNYRNILINNILLAIGYLIGTGLFLIIGEWQLIYLTGLLFSLVFIFRHLTLHKEPFRITAQFSSTLSKGFLLYVASLLKSLVNYADKLLILPLLGPSNVAVYYSASIIGKMISMVINPVNSVILSYLVKVNKMQIRDFLKVLSVLTCIALIGYFITVEISPYFFGIFYPDWAKASLEIVYITTATAVVGMVSSVIHPFNLRYNETKWQIYINGLYVIVYLGATLILSQTGGVVGFSWGVLTATVFNLILQIALFVLYTRKSDQQT